MKTRRKSAYFPERNVHREACVFARRMKKWK